MAKKKQTIKWHSHPSFVPYHNNFSHPLKFFVATIEADLKLKEKHKQMISNIINQQPTRRCIEHDYVYSRNLTPFEQAAYDLQHTPKNRISGPPIGEPLSINETTKDKQYILIGVCLTLFAILLILA
jgi:hypothetical protein